ncbi:MFS transporter [Streptomyces sp. NBC_00299]|uniref:MFS transporter n=1 Tax=Streptomyces sp. NBC_00299 TaxID=2975705 RepID=UPI002E28539C|nr:MFS transporter [Streptomyces sp. NBC_00299]
MGQTVTTGRRGTSAAYRAVIGLTGPLLPVMSFLARLPTATIQFGSVLLVARTSGSLAAAGLTGGALAVGQVACGPLVGRLADRHGQRTVVLVFSLANAIAIAGLVAAALAGLPTALLAVVGAAAGATVPQIGPMARARLVALARRAGARDSTVGAALSFESTLDEVSFVLGPALVGLAAVTAHPGFALGGAAVLVAVCGSGFGLHRTAVATRPGPVGASAERRPESVRTRAGRRNDPGAAGPVPPLPIPRSIHALRAALALQGAMFGACQAGITALTERLGQPDQAGLVYAAMGVMSAVAGLSMAAVPASLGLTVRWRAATAAAFLLSLPLLWTESLPALYVTVTVLGVAYAPHLITVFGLTERVVPPARLSEAMAFATSALVGGQALALAVTGRLAESYGPATAFGAASLAAALACAIALTARPASYSGRTATSP